MCAVKHEKMWRVRCPVHISCWPCACLIWIYHKLSFFGFYCGCGRYKSWHSGGCQYSQSDLVQVPFKKFLHGGRLNFSDWFLPLAFRFLDTLLPRVFEDCGSEGGSAFVTLMPKTALVSPLSTALFLSTSNKYLFLFQHHLIPCDSWPPVVVQLQYGFELRGLTCPHFVQTFQDVIGGNLWNR